MIIGTWPMWSVHTRNETTSRRYPLEVHAECRPAASRAWPAAGCGGGGGPPPRRSWRAERREGREIAERGPQEARAARVDSRYTAAASVSAMSARSDFYNAPCTLPHSRSLTPSHPPPRRGAEDPRERRASASVSWGDLRANVRERTNLRGMSDRASREWVLLVKWDPFEDFNKTFVNRAAARRKRWRMIYKKCNEIDSWMNKTNDFYNY